MTLRAMVVGCGFIGASEVVPGSGIQSHAAAWAHHPGATLVGLCDLDQARLTAASARWRVPVAGRDLDQALAQCRPDVVSIATPDETHADVVEAVLRHPGVRAILLEKPVALDLAEGRRLADAAAKRGVVIAVNYSRRYAPSHRLLKGWLDEEPLGAIEVVRGTYVRGLMHNGTHWLDLARWLVGEITEVWSDGPAIPTGDATVDLTLRFAGGARGSLTGVATATYSLFEMDLVGTHGRLQLLDGGQRFVASRGLPSRRFPGFRELGLVPCPPGGVADLLMHAVSDVVEALTTGRPPAGTIDDALAALAIAETALRLERKEAVDGASIGR